MLKVFALLLWAFFLFVPTILCLQMGGFYVFWGVCALFCWFLLLGILLRLIVQAKGDGPGDIF